MVLSQRIAQLSEEISAQKNDLQILVAHCDKTSLIKEQLEGLVAELKEELPKEREDEGERQTEKEEGRREKGEEGPETRIVSPIDWCSFRCLF